MRRLRFREGAAVIFHDNLLFDAAYLWEGIFHIERFRFLGKIMHGITTVYLPKCT